MNETNVLFPETQIEMVLIHHPGGACGAMRKKEKKRKKTEREIGGKRERKGKERGKGEGRKREGLSKRQIRFS